MRGSKALVPRQTKNQAAAGSEATPAWADTITGQVGSLHARTPEVEKQEEGGKAEGHDSGEIQVIT